MTLVQTEPKAIKIGSTAVKKVMLGNTQIRPAGWQPGANTIAYYPLTADTNDAAGNNNLTNSGLSFSTYDGVTCAYTNGGYATKSGSLFTGDPTFTASIWFKKTVTSNVDIWSFGTSGGKNSFAIWVLNGVLNTGGWENDRSTGENIDNNWHNVIWCYSSGSGTVYLDGTSVYNGTWSSVNIGNTRIVLGDNANLTGSYTGYLSNAIFENKVRTATEVSNYYNLTKGNYGL